MQFARVSDAAREEERALRVARAMSSRAHQRALERAQKKSEESGANAHNNLEVFREMNTMSACLVLVHVMS